MEFRLANSMGCYITCIKRLSYSFSCALSSYDVLGKLGAGRTQEARVALGSASSNSYTSFVLSLNSCDVPARLSLNFPRAS